MSVGAVRLRVTPEQLKVKADETSRIIENMQQKFAELTVVMENTSAYWKGEAGDLYRKVYKEDSARIAEILKMLREHPRDLLTMAGIYQEAEQKTTELSNALPADIIE